MDGKRLKCERSVPYSIFFVVFHKRKVCLFIFILCFLQPSSTQLFLGTQTVLSESRIATASESGRLVSGQKQGPWQNEKKILH